MSRNLHFSLELLLQTLGLPARFGVSVIHPAFKVVQQLVSRRLSGPWLRASYAKWLLKLLKRGLSPIIRLDSALYSPSGSGKFNRPNPRELQRQRLLLMEALQVWRMIPAHCWRPESPVVKAKQKDSRFEEKGLSNPGSPNSQSSPVKTETGVFSMSTWQKVIGMFKLIIHLCECTVPGRFP